MFTPEERRQLQWLKDVQFKTAISIGEIKKSIILLEEKLKQHIKEFDAHKEPIQLPNWLKTKK